MRNKSRDLSIIIPAAGAGRRMKSYGPKPMVEIGGETLIDRQICMLKSAYPAADIIVVLGFEADRIIRSIPSNIRVVENENYEETNVARSISMGLRATVNTRVLIVYGDLVFNRDTVASATSYGSSIIVDSRGMMRADEVGTNIVDGRVMNFNYGLPTKWCHIAYLTGRELDLFRRFAAVRDHDRLFGYEILNRTIDAGGKIRAIEPRNMRVSEIDTSKDIEQARRMWRDENIV